MKRLSLVLLIAIMLATVFSLSAFAYDEEITFLGLRFNESSIEDAINAMMEKGYARYSINEKSPVWTLFSEDESEIYAYTDTWDGGIELEFSASGASPVFVAGHKVSYPSLYFLYDVKDGVVDRSKVNFVKASYRFYTEDQFAVFDDLLEKLSTIYGEPNIYVHTQKFINAMNEMHTVASWYGPNDTAIVLSKEWRTLDGVTKEKTDYIGDDTVNLRYGVLNTSESIDTIEAENQAMKLEAEQQRIQENKENKDGL